MKKYIPIIVISIISIILCIWWENYTNFTAEDSFITFQFARRIAEGNGFALNVGQRIYGSTTPLTTLLLTDWLFVSKDVILGSKLIDLVAFTGGLWFLYFSFLDKKTAIIATSLIAVSMKLIAESMQGMETPLLFLFAMGAFYGYAKGKPCLSGIMCGLLLWTRIDAVVFVAALFVAHLFWGTLGRLTISTIKFCIGTLVYLPWLIFAKLYFGSIIPFTITAKIVAYGIGNPALPVHFLRIITYISWPVFLLTILSILYLPKRNIFLALFFVAHFLVISKSGSTFEPRYFYTLTVTSIIMIAIMASRIRGDFWKVAIIALVLYSSFNFNVYVRDYKNLQIRRNDVLKNIGLWFNHNTPAGSTIQLESLGYMGYYSNRVIYDEVGLVTPVVVEMHRRGLSSIYFYAILKTDYVLLQCHQADSIMWDFETKYKKIKTFDNGFPRSCYDVFQRLSSDE